MREGASHFCLGIGCGFSSPPSDDSVGADECGAVRIHTVLANELSRITAVLAADAQARQRHRALSAQRRCALLPRRAFGASQKNTFLVEEVVNGHATAIRIEDE